MARLRPGWLVTPCAAVLAGSAWLPWVTSRADGGGHANAIGGIVGNMPVPPPGFGGGQLIKLLASTLIVAGGVGGRGFVGGGGITGGPWNRLLANTFRRSRVSPPTASLADCGSLTRRRQKPSSSGSTHGWHLI